MRAIGLALLALFAGTTAEAQRRAAPAAAIWPKQAAGLPTVALGELIKSALPRGSSIGWDAMQIPSVRWITDGIETTETGYSMRQGLARVRASGAAAKMLRQGWVELAWSVTLEAEENAKFGPEKVLLQPGTTDSEYICFGTRFQGCSFPLTAITAPGLTLKMECERGPGGAHAIVFSASAAGGRSGTVVYQTDAGSGDITNSIEVLPGTAASFCSRPVEDR